MLAPGRRPSDKWLQDQDDSRMLLAAGPWWRVAPLEGGGVLVPEDLATFQRRATVDDVIAVMASDSVDGGMSTLRFLFEQLIDGGNGAASRPRAKND